MCVCLTNSCELCTAGELLSLSSSAISAVMMELAADRAPAENRIPTGSLPNVAGNTKEFLGLSQENPKISLDDKAQGHKDF